MGGLVLRQLHQVAKAELGVAGGCGAASLVPARELRQEDAQERGLQLVEAGVVADEVEGRLVARAVEGQELDALGELLVVRRDETSVAEAEEVLRGIEAEGRDRPVLRNFRCAESLRRILEHRHPELDERPDIEQPAKEVNRDDRPRPVGHLRRRVLEVEVERDGIDVREYRRGAAPHDRLRGRIEREGRADHLVAGPDAERVESEHERVGAVRDADRPLHAEIRSGFLLEGPVMRAADEPLALEYLAERGLEPWDQRLVFGSDVNEWNRLHAGPL